MFTNLLLIHGDNPQIILRGSQQIDFERLVEINNNIHALYHNDLNRFQNELVYNNLTITFLKNKVRIKIKKAILEIRLEFFIINMNPYFERLKEFCEQENLI